MSSIFDFLSLSLYGLYEVDFVVSFPSGAELYSPLNVIEPFP